MKKLFAILMSIMMIACFMPTVAFAAGFTVSITLPEGGHITKADTSGELIQTVDGTDITAVVCKAGEGYYFPTDYSSISEENTNGIKVERTDAATITISGTPTEEVNITLVDATMKSKEDTPVSVDFVATGYDTGKLTGLASGLVYKIDSGVEQEINLAESQNELEIVSLNPCEISVVKKGGDTTMDSDAKVITITRAEKPKNVSMKACTSNGASDGTLIGVSAGMEYQAKTDPEETTWIQIESETVSGLAAGTYIVRTKANEKQLASEGTEVTVTEPEALSTIPDEIISAISAYTGVYDGKAHDAIVVGEAVTEEYTLKYKVEGGEDFTDEMPRVTEVENEMPIVVEVSREGYTSKQTSELTPRITPKDVNFTIVIADKVYDGTTTAAIKEGTTPTTSDFVENDVVSLDLSTAAIAFEDKDAGEAKAVTITGAQLTGDAAANYNLILPTATATIYKATLTIDSATIEDKEYDGSDSATVKSLTFGGLVNSETLELTTDYSVEAYFTDADAGENKDVIVIVELKNNGNADKNYVLDGEAIDAKGNIKKVDKGQITKDVTVQKGTYGFVDIYEDIVFDGEIGVISVGNGDFFAEVPSVNEKGLLEFTLSGEASTEDGSNTVTITVPVINATNYADYEITVTVTVSEVEQLNVSAPRALDRTYDGTTQPLVEAGVLSDETYKLQYAVGDGEFAFTIPEEKNVKADADGNAEEYTVKYRVVRVDEDNRVTIIRGTDEFTPVMVLISPKEVTYAPKDITITEGSALPTPAIGWDGVISQDEHLVTELEEFAKKATFEYRNENDDKIDNPTAQGKYRIICTNTGDFSYTDFNYDVYYDEGTLTIGPKSSGGYYPTIPTTPTTPTAPSLDKAKTDSAAAISAAAAANKYDAAEQAEVKKIVDKANADIKNAKTEAEVKAIQEAAQAEIDKILTTEEKSTVAAIGNVEKRDFAAKSVVITRKNGKKAVRLTWAAPEGVKVDGYEIFRSTKRNSGYGTEPYFTTPNTSYTNTKELKAGKTYYYKVRAFVIINGEKVYTDFSMKAFRTIK